MKMKTILKIYLFVSVFLWSCSNQGHKNIAGEKTVESMLPAHLRGNCRMVWNDEFNGNAVNTAKWNFRAEGTVRNYATVSRHTISMDGKGHLSIKVTKDADGKYYVGELGTRGIYETRYGYFECRAKMNKSPGPHVAFWLQSPDPGKDGAEIDIFEYHRKTPGMVYHNLHWDGYGISHKHAGTQIPLAGIDSGFHTFGLEWTEKKPGGVHQLFHRGMNTSFCPPN